MGTNAAAAVIKSLSVGGIECVFGVPGVHNLALFEALEESELRTVLVRHEASAAHAADGYARAGGGPALCLTTSGPGAANTVAAMGEAWASKSPLLHITTTVAARHAGDGREHGLLHGHDRQLELLEPVSKQAVRCTDPAALAAEAVRLLAVACEPPMGPTYLEVPFDLLEGDAGAMPEAPAPAARQPPDPEQLAAAAALLQAAQRPILWAGSGSLGAVEPLLAIAERLDAPILLTHSAKRAFEVDHPLVLTEPPHEPAVMELVEGADAALVVGSDLDAMMTQEFALRLPEALVHVDADPGQIGRRYAAQVGLAAPAEAALPGLLGQLEQRPSDGTAAALVALRERVRGEISSDQRTAPAARVLDGLDAALPPDCTVVCDMAVAGYWATGYLPLRPARRLLYPMGWGTLGFALPAALGAALARPDARTVCICGDAGLLFYAGELATAVQEGLPLTVVVANDAGYGMLRYDEQLRFGRTFAADLVAPDFAQLAGAFGLPARSAELSDPALPALIEHACQAAGPALLELRGELFPPRTTSPRWPAKQR